MDDDEEMPDMNDHPFFWIKGDRARWYRGDSLEILPDRQYVFKERTKFNFETACTVTYRDLFVQRWLTVEVALGEDADFAAMARVEFQLACQMRFMQDT
jgi:hypothetical protein